MANKLKIENLAKAVKKFGKSKTAKRIGIGLGIFIVVSAVLFITFNLIYKDKIFPNTYIGGVNFGGKTSIEARITLEGLINQSSSGSLRFSFEDKDYDKKISDFDVDWQNQKEENVDRLLAVGRTGFVNKIIKEQLRAVFSKNNVLAGFSYSENKLDEFLKDIAKDIDKPEKDATIEIKESKPVVIPEEIGRVFPITDNKNIALKTIGSFDFIDFTPFLVIDIEPKVTAQGAQAALLQTETLLTSHLILKVKDKTFNLSSAEIGPMISFVVITGKKGVLGIGSTASSDSAKDLTVGYTLSPEITQEKLTEYIDKISSEINQPAQDAKFEVSGGRVQTFQVAQTGYELDKEETDTLIRESLSKGEITLELPVKVTQPKVADDASTVGIVELVGEGRTSWRGSPPNRIHNLTVGTKKISGWLIQPGEEFSTLDAIGEVGPGTEYLKELVIKNRNRVEPDWGGGLCQVSTTLFRAALNAGLKISARTAHSFRVSYYEPPVGIDATIFNPSPDLKFINTYKTPILIWGSAGNNSLTFQIFGTKDGRQVSVSDPIVGNYTSPGEPIYTESDTMAAGAIRQVERAVPGATASFTYLVTDALGAVLESETFSSKYVPVPNSYLYGPGTTGIPGVEGASTEAPPPEATPNPTPTPVTKETK